MGLHEWLNWSPLAEDGAYRWPPYRSADEWLAAYRPLSDWPEGDPFEAIHALGFDFVRLSVDPGPLLDSEGERRQQALDVLAAAVGRITGSGLKVVFDLHGVNQVPAYGMEMIYDGADSEGVAHYRQMVAAVATMLAKVGTDKVALEPYNEPAYYPCDASGTDDWQRIMAATVGDIRAVSTDLTIVVTGACGGSITGLTNLDPSFDDPNLYYSFHMYEPHSFTHQRLDDPTGVRLGPALAGGRQHARSGDRDAAGADERGGPQRGRADEQYRGGAWGGGRVFRRELGATAIAGPDRGSGRVDQGAWHSEPIGCSWASSAPY